MLLLLSGGEVRGDDDDGVDRAAIAASVSNFLFHVSRRSWFVVFDLVLGCIWLSIFVK